MPGFRIDLESDNKAAIAAARQLLGVYQQIGKEAGKVDSTWNRASAAMASGSQRSSASVIRDVQRAGAAHDRAAQQAERAAQRQAAAAEREAQKQAANAERWVAREYRDRVRYEQAKQREAERTAAKAERESQRAARTTEREAHREAAAVERAKQREARAQELAESRRPRLLTDDEVAERARTRIIEQENQRRVDLVARGATKAGRGNLGRSLLEVGRIVQDFSAAGMLGIVNNIEGLTAALGLGAGLAGILTVVGVAAQFAAPAIGKFFSSLFGAEDPKRIGTDLERLDAQIKELEEKPHKITLDRRALDRAVEQSERLKRNLKDFEAFGEETSRAEEESGQRVKEILGEAPRGGAPAIRREMYQARLKQLLAESAIIPQEEANAKNLEAQRQQALREGGPAAVARAQVFADQAAKARDRAENERRRLEGKARAEVGELYGESVRGNAEVQRKLAGWLRHIGRRELATEVESVSPERLRPEMTLEEEQKKADEEARRQDKMTRIKDKQARGEVLTAGERTFLDFERRRQQIEAPANLVNGVNPNGLGPAAVPALNGPAPAIQPGQQQAGQAQVVGLLGQLVAMGQGAKAPAPNVAPPPARPARQPAAWRDRP